MNPNLSKPQFNFWTLIIGCNLTAIILGAAFRIDADPNPLSVFVCFAAIACATAGVMLLIMSAIFAFSIRLSGEFHHNDSFNLRKCWDMAMIGAGLVGPGLLFTVMAIIRTLSVGFE